MMKRLWGWFPCVWFNTFFVNTKKTDQEWPFLSIANCLNSYIFSVRGECFQNVKDVAGNVSNHVFERLSAGRALILLLTLFSLITPVLPLSEGAKKIADRIAALKEKTHRTLTAAKDVAPLIRRVDNDLLMLESQKRALMDQKKSLERHKHALQVALKQRHELLSILQSERSAIDQAWERQTAQLDAFVAQKSIQVESEVLAQTPSRATLLARVFDLQTTPTGSLVAGNDLVRPAEDVRG
jgi:hypothetical protein